MFTSWLQTLERRASWLAFPQLFRTLILLQAVFFGFFFLKPDSAAILVFDWEAIRAGQIWRVISHFFIPPFAPGEGSSPLLLILMLFFYVSIGSMISDGVERAWGSFRASLFIYASIICVTLAACLLAVLGASGEIPGGIILYSLMFMTYAVIYPYEKLLLFLVIPVPFWLLGSLMAAGSVLSIVGQPLTVIMYLPLLLWAVPELLTRFKTKRSMMGNQRSFQKKVQQTPSSSLHRCATCDRTENDDASLEFRVSADGEEYCFEHLPPRLEA